MTKHIHVHLHDSKDGGTSTQRKSGGVTTWGGVDPKKVVPKSPIDQLYKKSKDAGTSEGAKKAAETRKHGGVQHFPGTEGTHFAGKPLNKSENYTKRITTEKGTIVRNSSPK